MADGGESIGLDIPHAGETLFDEIPGSGRYEMPLPPSIPIVSVPPFDPDDLVMDPPPVPEIPDIPPPTPPVEAPTYP